MQIFNIGGNANMNGQEKRLYWRLVVYCHTVNRFTGSRHVYYGLWEVVG